LEIKQSATYKNINELKSEGYLEKKEDLSLTDLGKMMRI
jgi:Mn-dependent DtxR family transcriptional regulator